MLPAKNGKFNFTAKPSGVFRSAAHAVYAASVSSSASSTSLQALALALVELEFPLLIKRSKQTKKNPGCWLSSSTPTQPCAERSEAHI